MACEQGGACCGQHKGSADDVKVDLSGVGDKPILLVRCDKEQLSGVRDAIASVWEEIRRLTKIEMFLVLDNSFSFESLTDEELAKQYHLYRKVPSTSVVEPAKSVIVDVVGKPFSSTSR